MSTSGVCVVWDAFHRRHRNCEVLFRERKGSQGLLVWEKACLEIRQHAGDDRWITLQTEFVKILKQQRLEESSAAVRNHKSQNQKDYRDESRHGSCAHCSKASLLRSTDEGDHGNADDYTQHYKLMNSANRANTFGEPQKSSSSLSSSSSQRRNGKRAASTPVVQTVKEVPLDDPELEQYSAPPSNVPRSSTVPQNIHAQQPSQSPSPGFFSRWRFSSGSNSKE